METRKRALLDVALLGDDWKQQKVPEGLGENNLKRQRINASHSYTDSLGYVQLSEMKMDERKI